MTVATADTGALLEREESLSILGELLNGVRSSRAGCLVVVGGEAGVGKTALLRRFCEEIREPVLWGTCEPLLAPRPLGPLLDVAAALGREFEELVAAGARAHEVAAALVVELSHRGPTVLVLEDLHWADEATLDVFRLLGRRVSAIPTLVLASYRDDQLDRVGQLQVVLGELAAVASTRLTVLPLSLEAVGELARQYDVNGEELHRTTGGNPFFVTEVLSARGQKMPATVREAVLARAARLPEPDRRLLQTVAVIPGDVEIWMLEALAGESIERLGDCLASGMLSAGPAHVAFRHELARVAIEESLAPDRRVHLHRRALATLVEPASGAPDLARLAHHAEAAGDTTAVLRFAPAAALHAASVGARREAERQYARALRFGNGLEPAGRADLLERFAIECYLTDMREEALVALDEALAIHRDRGDLHRQAEVQRLRARQLVCVFRREDAWAAATEAVTLLERFPPNGALARAYAVLSELSMDADDADGASHWGLRAIDLAESVGETEALAHALNCVGLVEFVRGAPEGRARLERAFALAEAEGHELEAGRSYVHLAIACSRRRDWKHGDQVVSEGIQYCRDHGLEAWVSVLVSAKADSALAQGRWDEAAETATLLLSASRDFVVSPRFTCLLVLALVRARRGDPEYWPLLNEALECALARGDLEYLAMVASARAEAMWLEGRPEGIADATDDAYSLARKMAEPSFLGELACWRWRAGLLAAPPPGAAEIFRLQIAGEWQSAAKFWSDQDCPYEAALALADSNDDQALHRALDELQALGARPAAAIVARRLRARGARGLPRGPRARTRANPAGLTAREVDVLMLVADGLRNARIAERLVLSEKTVDHHVSAILRKLDAKTRGQAAADAVRLGVIPHREDMPAQRA